MTPGDASSAQLQRNASSSCAHVCDGRLQKIIRTFSLTQANLGKPKEVCVQQNLIEGIQIFGVTVKKLFKVTHFCNMLSLTKQGHKSLQLHTPAKQTVQQVFFRLFLFVVLTDHQSKHKEIQEPIWCLAKWCDCFLIREAFLLSRIKWNWYTHTFRFTETANAASRRVLSSAAVQNSA